MNKKHAVTIDAIQSHLATLGQIVTKQAAMNKALVARVHCHQQSIEARKFYVSGNAH